MCRIASLLLIAVFLAGNCLAVACELECSFESSLSEDSGALSAGHHHHQHLIQIPRDRENTAEAQDTCGGHMLGELLFLAKPASQYNVLAGDPLDLENRVHIVPALNEIFVSFV